MPWPLSNRLPLFLSRHPPRPRLPGRGGRDADTGYRSLPAIRVDRSSCQRAPTQSVGREVFPLICPTCQAPLTFIAFLTDAEPIIQILAHIGEPTSPPLLHPARGPPQALIPQIEYWVSFELWGAVKRSPIYGGRDLEEGEDLDLEIGEVGLEDGDLRSLLVEAVAFEEAEQA